MDFEISGFSLLVLAIVVLAVVIVAMGVRAVPQGYEYTVERFGRYTRTLPPGLGIIFPVIDRIGTKMNMMETVLDVPQQEVITRDNALVQVDGVVFYQVLDAAAASYEVRDLERAVLNLTMTNIRTVMGSMDLDELLSRRDDINTRLLHVVDVATEPWGIKVTRIEILDITPPTDLVESMGRQMKAERDKRATVLVAEGDRQAQVLRAEGEKQAQILAAEGRREAAFRDAEAREREAEAEAKATTMVSEAIARGDVNAVNYFVAQRYVEAFGKFATSNNQKTFILPMEATSLIGAVGGIAEIARDAMALRAATRGDGPPSGSPPSGGGSRTPRSGGGSGGGGGGGGGSANPGPWSEGGESGSR
jgi:regulator of protease activity HflC (stomatin/prohibitin superfamily)